MRFANERTREVQRQQTERTHIQLTSVEKRLADLDVMGIEMQAISPAPVQMYYCDHRGPSGSAATPRKMTRLAPCTGSNPQVSCRTPAILRREGLPRP